MNGKIISSQRGMYVVYSDGVTYNVFPRGALKFKKQHLNVGDLVIVNDDDLTILAVEPRTNELIRPKCSNVDQLFIVMSVVEPDLSPELLYKFLTYANMNNIVAKVVFTKSDLCADLTQVELLKNDLEKLGIEVFFISLTDQSALDALRQSFLGKTSIFMGQTGVGKSSLINEIDSSFERKIGSYSEALGRGRHQTKEVILLPYENGFLGDTPGFSSLDLGIFKEDLAQFFPGYNQFYTKCFYSDCLHQKEKNCCIKNEISSGHLSPEGYKIYLKLLDELPFRKERYK